MRVWLALSTLTVAGVIAASDVGRRIPGAVEQRSNGVTTWHVTGLSRRVPRPARTPDPDLEPGFPVQTWHGAGSYQSGRGLHTLVAQLDADPQLEIVKTALAYGPLHAWNHDGTPLAGWPAQAIVGAAYPGAGLFRPLGPLSKLRRGVFSGHWGFPGQMALWRPDGSPWPPAWPRNSVNYVPCPPAMVDLDGDGGDEILVWEGDDRLRAYHADGQTVAGWSDPPRGRCTPAIADLDDDGVPEIITYSPPLGGGQDLLRAYRPDATPAPGFPITLGYVTSLTYPVVGDVDGDGELEIVVGRPAGQFAQLDVFSHKGGHERSIPVPGYPDYGVVPALADLDGDSFPEILVQSHSRTDVFKGDGTSLPGWPQLNPLSGGAMNSAPVVGDVTGDGQPDVVIVNMLAADSSTGQVWVLHKDGTPHPGFPKVLPISYGMVPAIADIDLDGRNELVVGGSYWNGIEGYYDDVWVYDLHGSTYGPILWGQFLAGPRHHGRYGEEPSL